jgi:hypothetical protein
MIQFIGRSLARLRMLFYQIRKNGHPVDQTAYPTFEQACAVWEHHPEFQEVVHADTNGKILHVFTAEECRKAALRFRNPKTK